MPVNRRYGETTDLLRNYRNSDAIDPMDREYQHYTHIPSGDSGHFDRPIRTRIYHDPDWREPRCGVLRPQNPILGLAGFPPDCAGPPSITATALYPRAVREITPCSF